MFLSPAREFPTPPSPSPPQAPYTPGPYAAPQPQSYLQVGPPGAPPANPHQTP